MVDPIILLTGVLVLVTAYYAWQTGRMVKEMKKARQSQFMPYLKIMPTSLYLGGSFDIKIINIGLGPSKNIKGKIRLEPNGGEKEIVYTILYPKESFGLHEPFKDIQNWQDAKKFEKIILSVKFEDIANHMYEVEEVFVLDDIDKIKNDDYSRDPVSDGLSDIKYKLDDIKSAIEHLKR